MSDVASDSNDLETQKKEAAAKALEAAVWRKVTLRLIPLLFLLYLVNILDRVNVGFAKLTMLDDLGLTDKHYGFFAGLFYIGYILFEVPSNLILERTGARVWIARIIISWGIVSGAMMFVSGWLSFAVLRVLLGIAEAGFFPGMILYLTYWFPARARGRAIAFFMIASPIAGVLGMPVSGAIMQFMNGVSGLAGWQWLFLIEAIPSVVLGFVVWFSLTDRPEQARWLNDQERGWLTMRMAQEDKRRPQRHLLQALFLPGVWLLCLVYFSVAVGTNGMGFFLPSFVKELFPGRGEATIGLLSAIPSAAAVAGMVLVGRHSDRTGERRWHIALSAFLGAAGMVLSVTVAATKPGLALAAMALAYFGMFSMLPTFWALATHNVSGVAAAGAIALINSVANFGGFLAPTVVGWIKDGTGQFTGGAWFMGVTLVLGGVLVLCASHDATLEQK
jgi:D-galactonate transporter